MSAVIIALNNGEAFYTKAYSNPEEVRAAVERGEVIPVFWFARWGRRFDEKLLLETPEVAYYLTEREIP